MDPDEVWDGDVDLPAAPRRSHAATLHPGAIEPLGDIEMTAVRRRKSDPQNAVSCL